MKKLTITALLLASFGTAFAADPAPEAKPAEAAPAATLRDPGLEALSAKEREQYVAALKEVMKKPEVLAARQAAVKAQDEMLKASAKMREVRDAALSASSPAMPDIVKKVEASRRAWSEHQRDLALAQKLPHLKAGDAAPSGVPGLKPVTPAAEPSGK